MSSPRLSPWLMPGDDELGLEAVDQPELREAHAVDRRAVRRVADRAVVEVDLLDPQRPPRRDRARSRGAVPVRRDHRQLDSGSSSSARRSASRPSAWMPSSLVSRTFMGLGMVVGRSARGRGDRRGAPLGLRARRTIRAPENCVYRGGERRGLGLRRVWRSLRSAGSACVFPTSLVARAEDRESAPVEQVQIHGGRFRTCRTTPAERQRR